MGDHFLVVFFLVFSAWMFSGAVYEMWQRSTAEEKAISGSSYCPTVNDYLSEHPEVTSLIILRQQIVEVERNAGPDCDRRLQAVQNYLREALY
jgi:hypothetical protein